MRNPLLQKQEGFFIVSKRTGIERFNETVLWTVSGEGLTEPLLCFPIPYGSP